MFFRIIFIITWVAPFLSIAQNIGIATPEGPTRAKLEVADAAGFGTTGAIFGTDGAGISLQRNWPSIGFNQYRDDILPGIHGRYLSNGFASVIYLHTELGNFVVDMFPSGTANNYTPAPNTVLTISPLGHVGIRTNSLQATLSVGRGDGINGTAVFLGDVYASHFNYQSSNQTYIRGGTASSKLLINRESQGDVLIGAGSTRVVINRPNSVPGATVDVSQVSGTDGLSQKNYFFNHRWGQRASYANTLNNGQGNFLDFSYNGTGIGRFQFWNGAFIQISDARYKTDIEPMGPVMKNLLKLRPVEYQVDVDGSGLSEKHTGLIAQEVKPLFPWLVRIVDNDQSDNRIRDLHTMNYSGLGVIAIKALQEQEEMIQTLENEYMELLSRLEAIEKKAK